MVSSWKHQWWVIFINRIVKHVIVYFMTNSFMNKRVGRSSDKRSKPQHPTDAKNSKN
jgi:hypothetical protein